MHSCKHSCHLIDPPTEADKTAVLNYFGQSADEMTCVYCGERAQDWDHLWPLVRFKRPTGMFSGKGNVVPACGTCNQSKSGSDWEKWMRGPAKHSPRTRGISDLERRIERLIQYTTLYPQKAEKLEDMVNPDLWQEYWYRLERLHASLREAQSLAEAITVQIKAKRLSAK